MVIVVVDMWMTSVVYLRTSLESSQRHVIKFSFNRLLFPIVSVFSLPSFLPISFTNALLAVRLSAFWCQPLFFTDVRVQT